MIETCIMVLGVTGAMLALGLALRASERSRGDEKAARVHAEADCRTALANAKTESARADFEKGRADALDAAIVVAAHSAPVDGAYVRLLEAAEAARTAGGAGAGGVRDAGASSEPAKPLGPDDLLPPGA